jgi:hypothetical protein
VPKVGTNQRTRDLPHGRTLHSFIARSDSTLLSAIGIEVLRRGTAADGLGLLHYEHATEVQDNLETEARWDLAQRSQRRFRRLADIRRARAHSSTLRLPVISKLCGVESASGCRKQGIPRRPYT